MAFLPDPNDFIGRAATGEPALCCVPEDDPHNIVRDALREGDIIEFEGVRFFNEDALTIRQDGTWSTINFPPADANCVEYGAFSGQPIVKETVDELAATLLRSKGAGTYEIAFLSRERAEFIFKGGRFERVTQRS